MAIGYTICCRERTQLKITEAQKEEVCSAVLKWIKFAEDRYKLSLDVIPIHFDLRGKTSGMFCYRDGQAYFRFNEAIFSRYFEDSIEQTVPHEVAHYVVFRRYIRRKKPHGKEWQAVMQDFGIPADVTCKLDISDLPSRKLKRFQYRCPCNTHQLTSIRHNRILSGVANYACPKCHQALVYTP